MDLKTQYAILEKLIKPMDLPFNRKKELNPAKIDWLHKRMALKNKDHKNFQSAMEIIERLL